VAGSQWEDGTEVAVVDVHVGAAHADLVHLDAHLVRPGLGAGDLEDGVLLRGVVDDCLHDDSLCSIEER